MTLEEKRECLNLYLNALAHVKVLQEELESLRSFAEKVTQAITDDIGSGATNDRVGKVAIRLVEAKKDVEEEIERCMQIRKATRKLIYDLSEGEDRDIMKRRFLLGQKIREIANEKGYEERSVRRKIRKIISQMDFSEFEKMSFYVPPKV